MDDKTLVPLGETKPALPKFRWDINPRVVLQLGETLITDDVTALLELIKNAYDADASYCVVTIESRYRSATPDLFPDAIGRVIIEDDGTGMGLHEIQDGWLTVSNSPKAQMKAQGSLTRKNRTPLGDKGLGRLGVQRMGRYVELCTGRRGEAAYHIGIDWDGFRTAERLSDVPVRMVQLSPRIGTRIVVSGLNNLVVWEEPSTIQTLQRKLSQLIFPFSQDRPFRVFLTVNGIEVDLAEIPEKLRDTANIRIGFDYDGRTLKVQSRFRLNMLLSGSDPENDREDFKQFVEADNGSSFFTFLANNKKFATNLQYEGRDGWFARSWTVQSVVEIPGIERLSGQIANPGPFHGEIDSFNLRQGYTSVFDRQKDYGEYIKSLAGIKVFRDGFGIRPYGFEGNDWLGLSRQQTEASSFYGLRPGNTIGYVSISSAENPCLPETTSREGFQDNAYYRNFYRLISEVTAQVQRHLTSIRRGYNEFRKGLVVGPSLKRKSDARGVATKMRSAANRATSLTRNVNEAEEKAKAVEEQLKATQSTVNEFQGMDADWISPEIRGRIEAAHSATKLATEIITTLQGLLSQVKEQLAETSSLSEDARQLEYQLDTLEEQLEGFTELAGLGLTVEALVHEIHNITGDLTDRTRALEDTLVKAAPSIPKVRAYVEHVKATISSLHKQMSHLTPALRYVREQKDRFDVCSMLRNDVVDHYAERWREDGIDVRLECETPFSVAMNRGRLLQVIDNLVINSQYWVSRFMKSRGGKQGHITFRVHGPFVDVFDSGPGVDSEVEFTLFDPFITKKPPGEGRGLGLFIVRQLLEYADCRISLLPDVNDFGRRYIFQLDLSGVIVHDNA